MRCKQLGLSPLFPGAPQRVTIGPLPITLLPPASALQKRDKAVGIPKRFWGPEADGGLCGEGAANGSEEGVRKEGKLCERHMCS